MNGNSPLIDTSLNAARGAGVEGPHGGRGLHSARAGWSEGTPQCEERGHGVADAVPETPAPLAAARGCL